MQPVSAVIPAAGRGTRLAPLTPTVPKELLPLGRRPAIYWTLREAAEAGLHEACVVVSPTKPALVEVLRRLDGRHELPRIKLAFQEEPLGLGDAIARARDFTGDGWFAILLPDNLFWGEGPAVAGLLEPHRRTGRAMAGLLDPARDFDPRHSSASYQHLAPGPAEGLFRVTGMDKPAPGERDPDQTYLGIGRYILPPEFHDCVEAVRQRVTGELGDIEALRRLLESHEILATCVPGLRYDLGTWGGYEAAFRRLAREAIE